MDQRPIFLLFLDQVFVCFDPSFTACQPKHDKQAHKGKQGTKVDSGLFDSRKNWLGTHSSKFTIPQKPFDKN